jgi:hypothetical protein
MMNFLELGPFKPQKPSIMTLYKLVGGDGSGVQVGVKWEWMTESNWFWSKSRLGARCRSVCNLARCRFHRDGLGDYELIIATAALFASHGYSRVATVNIDHGVLCTL